MLLTNIAKDINWWLMFEIRALDGSVRNASDWVQQFNIPSIMLNSTIIPYQKGNYKVPSNVPEWGQIDMMFLLDENWESYTMFLDWMFANADKKGNSFGNITAIALDAYQKPVFKLQYLNVIPNNITDLQMLTSNTNNPITFSVQMDYSQFTYKKIGNKGLYNIGSGEGTSGSYLTNGSWSSSNANVAEKSEIFRGKLLRARAENEPWSIELVGDDWPEILDDGTRQMISG